MSQTMLALLLSGKVSKTGAPIHHASATLIVAISIWMSATIAHADCGVTATGIPEDVAATVDLAGLRKDVAKIGFMVGGFYAGETFSNLGGGIKQGSTYDGVLELHVNGDLQKLGLWRGLCFYSNGYQIHGQSVTVEDVGSLATISNLEALPATRLYELWLEQKMLDRSLSVRVGQLAADGDFFVTEGGAYFLDGTWGWPTLTAVDLPSGGPAYPIATPGVRVAVNPNDAIGFKVAIYNGDPAGPNCTGDPQVCDENGLEFRLDVPPLLMSELSYTYAIIKSLPGTIKVGAWNHFGTFEHQRFESSGVKIAASGNPGRPVENDWGGYVTFDQLIWRARDSHDPNGLGLFGRIFGAPSDRNLVNFYAEGGVTFTGMIPRRPDDALAIGFAYTGISDHVHDSDIDGGLLVAHTYEALFEICYTFEIRTGWSVQPDFQYIWNPGGNVPSAGGTGDVPNASVVGVRSTVSF